MLRFHDMKRLIALSALVFVAVACATHGSPTKVATRFPRAAPVVQTPDTTVQAAQDLATWNAAVQQQQLARFYTAVIAQRQAQATTTTTTTTTPPRRHSAAPSSSQAAGSSTGHACGGDLPSCCVMNRESGGSPTAYNGSSGAAGKWQFEPGTWAGYGGYSSASQAPESVQDARARQVYAGGAGASNWAGPGC